MATIVTISGGGPDAADQRSQVGEGGTRHGRESASGRSTGRNKWHRPIWPCRAAPSEFESAGCSSTWFYRPNRAIKAATRAGGQRLTINAPVGSTSTPSPGLRTTSPPPAGRVTFTLPSTTKTDVFPFRGIDGPLRAAYRCDRLRRHHVEPIAAGLLRYLDQEGLVAEFDGIDVAIAIAVLEFEFRAVLGHDRNRRRALQRLRCVSGRLRDAAEIGGLGCGVTGEQAEDLQMRSNRRVPVLSWQLPLRGTDLAGMIRERILHRQPVQTQ